MLIEANGKARRAKNFFLGIGMFTTLFGKYRTLILAVTAFLVLFLGVLVLNFIISDRIDDDAVSVNLAGRQRMLSQRMTKASLQVLDRVREDKAVDTALAELKLAVDLFESTLKGFKSGATVTGGAGNQVSLNAVGTQKGQGYVDQAKQLFDPFATVARRNIANGKPTVDEALAAARQAEAMNLKLLGLMNDLTTDIERTASTAADRLRITQGIAALLALAIFSFILFRAVGQLRTGDKALESARKETNDILRTTQEGLFLLDPEYGMGQQHSASLTHLLGIAHVGGVNFLDLMRPLVTPKTLDTAKEYIDLLLAHDVNEKLVQSLNPLDAVEINVAGQAGQGEAKYLQFKFNRVTENDKVTHLLVTAADISKRIRLEKELVETEQRAESQMAMMVQILQVEPASLQQYLTQAAKGLEAINEQLRERGPVAAGLLAKIDAIYRITHRLKGDGAAVGLGKFAEGFHGVESVLDVLKQKNKLVGEDFLPVATRIKQLYSDLEAVQGVVTHISQVRGVVTVEPSKPAPGQAPAEFSFVDRWRSFANEIAVRQGKQVEVTYRGIDLNMLPAKLAETVMSVVNQFLRNAVAHGIETKQDRQTKGKPEFGRIAVYATQRPDEGIDLSFRDDGAGISVDNVKAAAVRRGRITQLQADTMDARAAIALIFEPGFSTKDTADTDAGRGAGLDAVKEMVAVAGGHIRIGSTAGEYCHFRVSFPAMRAPSLDLDLGAIGA
jgi:two-component system, chemotaxis family, sensor kinase CheA